MAEVFADLAKWPDTSLESETKTGAIVMAEVSLQLIEQIVYEWNIKFNKTRWLSFFHDSHCWDREQAKQDSDFYILAFSVSGWIVNNIPTNVFLQSNPINRISLSQ